jgi:hypothetical protein
LLRLVLAWHLAGVQVPEPPALPIAGVQWSAPASCPDRAELLVAISRRLGRELAADELALDARVVRNGARHALRLRVVVGDRSELRELSADACAPLVDATALLVVHTLGQAASESLPPGVVADEPAPTPAEPPAPDPEPAPTPAPEIAVASEPIEPTPVAPTPPAPRPRGPGVLLRAHGGPELGAVPRITGLGGLAVGLLWPRLRLEARASFLGPRSTTVEGTAISALLLAGSLHACVRLARGALEVPVCAGLEAGGMRGSASGPAANRAAFMPWVGVVLGVGVAWRVRPRLALWSALEAVGGVVRPNFVAQGSRLFEPFPASGRLLVGLELRLRDPR